MTARLFTLAPIENFRPKTFAGHRDIVLGAYFSADCKTVRYAPYMKPFVFTHNLDLHSQP